MNLLIYPGKSLESYFLTGELLAILEISQELSNSMNIFLPFGQSNDKILYLKYPDLESNNITLPKAYHPCTFIIYHTLTPPLINQVIDTLHIDAFLNLYELFPLPESYHFHCKSVIWLKDDHPSIPHLINQQLKHYHMILSYSPTLYLQLKKVLVRHNIRYATSVSSQYSLPDTNTHPNKPIITSIIDMGQVSLMDTLLDVWENYHDTHKMYLYPENHIQNITLKYTIPLDFKIGSVFTLRHRNHQYQIRTDHKTHKLGGTYSYQTIYNLLWDYQEKFQSLGIESVIATDAKGLIRSSHKCLILSRNHYYTQYTQTHCIYTLIPNLPGNKDILRFGRCIPIKVYHGLWTFDREEVNQFLSTSIDTIVPQIPTLSSEDFISIFYTSNYHYFTKLYLSNKDVEPTLLIEDDLVNIKNLILRGNYTSISLFQIPNYHIIFYLLSECPHLDEVYYIGSVSPSIDDYISTIIKIWPSVKILSIEVDDWQRNFTLNIERYPSHLLIEKKKDKLLSLYESCHYLKNLFIVDKNYTFYRFILQENRKLIDYESSQCCGQHLIIEDDGVQKRIKEKLTYPIDIFYGVPVSDLVKKKDWYQVMVGDNYLHWKSKLKEADAFIRFFRHRILWEELYDNKQENTLIREVMSEEYNRIIINNHPFQVPNVDIIFFKDTFRMEMYYVSHQGLGKLIQYTRPFMDTLENHIKALCLQGKLYYHCIGMLPTPHRSIQITTHTPEPDRNFLKSNNYIGGKGGFLWLWCICPISNIVYTTLKWSGYISWSCLTFPFWIRPYSKRLWGRGKFYLIQYLLDQVLKK